MSEAALVDVLQRINGMGCVLMPSEALPAATAQLRQLSTATVVQQQAEEANRRAEIASAYGYRSAVADKPFVYADGVAIIPVHGILLNRFSYSWGFVTGYNAIRGMMNAAEDDEDVKLIVFDENSNGGEAAGCFELAREVKLLSKPTLAVVDSNCCSAAYAVASGADKVVCIPSGTVGSIGVIASHFSMEGYLNKIGIEATLIFEGPHKGDGNPYQNLSKAAKADIAERVSQRMTQFISLVADNRGDKGLDEDAIRATESRAYLAAEALDLKLIDAIQTPAEAVSAFLAELGATRPSDDEGEDSMAMTDAEKAEHESRVTAAKSEGQSEGATAERNRIKDIMAHPEAKDRPITAQNLAMNTSMSVSDAGAFLAAQPKEAAPQAEASAPAAEEKSAPDAGEGALKTLNEGADAGVGPNGEGEQGKKKNRAQAALAARFGDS